MQGRVISGFQGIGKSTLTADNLDMIDLESTCFDKNTSNWYVAYCETAMNLAEQGYTVFISSHQVVRDYMRSRNGFHNYFMIMFHPDIKQYVLENLITRYETSKLDKDFRALKNATLNFDSIVDKLVKENEDGLLVYWITDKDYKLADIVADIQQQNFRKDKLYYLYKEKTNI